MFELHDLSPDKDGLAEKVDKIISKIKENEVGNLEENVISDDDVTIVLSQTDDDKSISEDSSKKKRNVSVTSDQSSRLNRTSPTSNKSKIKGKSKSKRGFNFKKKLNEVSENVLQVKPVVDENQNGSSDKTKTPSEQEVEKVKLPNDSKVMAVRRGRKVIVANINSIPTRSPENTVEKSSEESTVKTRGRRAAATSHSTQKNNEHQSESDGEIEEELKGPAKFKKFKNMTDRMGSAVVLLQRLSPVINFQSRVANQKSSSEEKSAVPDETVTSKLVEDKIPGAELNLSLDDVDDSKSKALSPRKREIESVSEVSEEKRPRVEEDTSLIVIATPDTSVAVLIEENSPTAVVTHQITTPGRRRGRPRKSITPLPTNQIPLKEDDVVVVVGPESKKNFPAKSKPKLHSESSDELAEDFVEEAAGVSESQPSAKENEASNQDTRSIDQKEPPIEDSPSSLTLKRGRGRPPKAASRSVLANILTRRNSNTRSVTPPKKNRLSDEISIISVVESRGDVENSEKRNVTNDIQKKDVKSGARRGRGRPAKATISPKTTIEKSPVVIVATRSTRKTTSLTPLEKRMKCCNVLLERDPEVEALCIAMINSAGKRKKMAAATSRVPVAVRVTRGMQKLASKPETDSKISPLFPRRKRFI